MALDAEALALAGQQHVRLALPHLQRCSYSGYGQNSGGAVAQRRDHGTGGPQHVENHADCSAQIALPQHGQFGRAKENFQHLPCAGLRGFGIDLDFDFVAHHLAAAGHAKFLAAEFGFRLKSDLWPLGSICRAAHRHCQRQLFSHAVHGVIPNQDRFIPLFLHALALKSNRGILGGIEVIWAAQIIIAP